MNQEEKPKRRRLIIVAIVLIAVVVVAVGIYALMQGGGGGTTPSASPTTTPTATVSGGGGTSPSASVTPTPTATATVSPSASVTPTPTPTSTTTGVAGASSLQFTESITNSSGAVQGTYTYYAKNIGTSNSMIRIELTDIPSSSDMVYIVNGALQQAWMETGGQWTDMSSGFASNWSSWNSTFVGVQNNLTGWTGAGDYTYTDPNGDSVRIYNIAVNPSLADSLFTH